MYIHIYRIASQNDKLDTRSTAFENLGQLLVSTLTSVSYRFQIPRFSSNFFLSPYINKIATIIFAIEREQVLDSFFEYKIELRKRRKRIVLSKLLTNLKDRVALHSGTLPSHVEHGRKDKGISTVDLI